MWRLGDSLPAELQEALSLSELSPVSLALLHAILLAVSLPLFLSLSLGLLGKQGLAPWASRLSSHMSVSLSESFISSVSLSLSLLSRPL